MEPRRGSIVRRQMVQRDRYSGHHRLMADYFDDPPVYNDNIFWRRFRMTKAMLWDIAHAVATKNKYFRRSANAANTWGFTTKQKVTTALGMLAYGGPADRLDECFRMGESTILEHRMSKILLGFFKKHEKPRKVRSLCVISD
ncbi:hypothetical protein BAE44_0013651 [Dichanthelium oligosanthes]|uniref:Uncharacterized protein n=1 Tax=Dichanthelium oligosanthes TaxID=888268 RepID=A0A1E5VJM2_9POAL|nr:hypothetical protein BAE44_0013651 [Dichanthelium oligosanthes]